MLNFRKLKQNFSPAILKDGKKLFDQESIVSAKIMELAGSTLRVSSTVSGNFDNTYECELEVDRYESEAIDSDCDCPYTYDCQHLAALVFYLEENLDQLVVSYSKETDLEECDNIDEVEKEELKATFEEAIGKEDSRKGAEFEKELLAEYVGAAKVLGVSPFFLPRRDLEEDRAELAVIFNRQAKQIFDHENTPEMQLALRLPFRSKPLHIPHAREFLDAVRHHEPIYIAGRRYFFTTSSFDERSCLILNMILDQGRCIEGLKDRNVRVVRMDMEAFGTMLATVYDMAMTDSEGRPVVMKKGGAYGMPCLYDGGVESPLLAAPTFATLSFGLKYVETPLPKLLLEPTLGAGQEVIRPEEGCLFECAYPGLIHESVYYRFGPEVKRVHLHNLSTVRDMTVPEPLFGTFVENSLPELQRFAEVTNQEVLERFVTLPYVEPVQARCHMAYLDGELDAELFFIYDGEEIPAATSQLTLQHLDSFSGAEGLLARNLTEEREVINELFQGFQHDEGSGIFSAKTSKKIVEFMTEIVPKYQHCVNFECPANLLEQFIYDETDFVLKLRPSESIGFYEVDLQVNGHLKGLPLSLLWECIGSKKTFVELDHASVGKGKVQRSSTGKVPRILVLDLERVTPVIQLFDELGIKELSDHVTQRPLWSLVTIQAAQFDGLPVKFTMAKKLLDIQQQMIGDLSTKSSPVPKTIDATLRNYQLDGVHWLEKLRTMHLNGVLADDMGLGKTLQAIIAVTQLHKKNKGMISMVVCPTSLTYNWKEEFAKFNSKIRILLVDGTPQQRKKLIQGIDKYDVVITSYTLLQKDVEHYKETTFGYCILDEAQHIKNRTTRNARSVKEVNAQHRLILTGTPIENSLDELWSLFDFLMPGLLSSYERFVEKYVRNSAYTNSHDMLRKKVLPFVLRRMKEDVLDDLPPVSKIVYRCHLTKAQEQLYKSYAASAREELQKLVEKEGFEKVHIHVLATLTRLKQICCHPAIFAKEDLTDGDSAKYDMLMEILDGLIESGHKTVIFSQYTKMLQILREGLKEKGIPYSYLDGSTKDRVEVVNQFNQDPGIPVFLVSLKAGGTGLNITGADTVIHYDIWWNPAVENQATDRVHRIGQQRSVSSYKLVTVGTIEEKIIELQERKRGLVKQIISDDEEVLSKLTWEEVQDLLEV